MSNIGRHFSNVRCAYQGWQESFKIHGFSWTLRCAVSVREAPIYRKIYFVSHCRAQGFALLDNKSLFRDQRNVIEF